MTLYNIYLHKDGYSGEAQCFLAYAKTRDKAIKLAIKKQHND